MRIVWDEPKRLANLEKHGFDFADFEAEFFLSAVVVNAKNSRLMAFGKLNGQRVSVVFRLMGSEALSIISVRPANVQEWGFFDD